MKYCENYIFVGKLSHSLVPFVLFTWVTDQGPSSTVAFLNHKQNTKGKVGTYHFTIIKRNITIIFQEYFSSLRFDSDKIWPSP